jgi:transcription-repair coupling factor (superfamily II helicase)
MKLRYIFNDYRRIESAIKEYPGISIFPNSGIILSCITEELKENKILVVAETTDKVRELHEILPDSITNPEFGPSPFEIDYIDNNLVQKKIQFLQDFYEGKSNIVISTIKGLLDPVLPYESLTGVTIQKGETYKLSDIVSKFTELGYKRTKEISETGEFSVKGSIIDIFSGKEEFPIRILFGIEGEVEQLKLFDLQTMKSFEKRDKITILPNTYYLFNKKEWKHFEESIKTEAEKIDDEYLRDSLLRDYEEVRKGSNFGINHYFKFFKDAWSVSFPTLIESTADFTKIFSEPLSFSEFVKQTEEIYRRNSWDEQIIKKRIEIVEKSLTELRKGKTITMKVIPENDTLELPASLIPENFSFMSNPQEYILSSIKEKSVIITTEQYERIKELLKLYELTPEKTLSEKPGLYIRKGYFERGIETDIAVVLTDREIFPKYTPQKARKKHVPTKSIISVEELKDGDYVVHRDFGIGIFRGLVKLEEHGTKEYLLIEYRDSEKLYVPLERIGFVDKYIGDRAFINLNRLAGNEWKNTKERAKENAKLLARKLLITQAERRLNSGFSFSQFQKEERIMELSFPYELTEDQEKALQEVYGSMESNEPMDRIICGDVGYGKTEIAVRASLRAALNGKQVAILVPTTILAMQHARTFKERFRLFPVEISMLSRLTEKKQEKLILKKIEQGGVDIVIGTHRILSNDIKFKDLGLLIIDEEQKFGVKHKERLKEIRANVDVLTLTATPIPRTLHSAIMKLRSVSLINTPPEGRVAVKTFVYPFGLETVRKAIEFELERKGQVFIVHNKIEDIYSFAMTIKQLVPRAKIDVAHGKMRKDEIEKIMLSFYEGTTDILVSTTIIENGLDIPTVNTLIVDSAENFGLSQMYQLRGRIGRSHINAFAYFLYTGNKDLKSIAEERLETIKEFSGLSSGIKIALKDLEIRGAGNLLGKEQHGHVISVGYNLYVTLLQEAVNELKGEKKAELQGIPIKLNETYYIPEAYISINTERIEYYRRITTAKAIMEIYNIRNELLDRFGEIPKEVDNLLIIGIMNCYARDTGISEIYQEEKRVFLSIPKGDKISVEGLQKFLSMNQTARFGENYMSFEVDDSPLEETLNVLNLLKGARYADLDSKK